MACHDAILAFIVYEISMHSFKDESMRMASVQYSSFMHAPDGHGPQSAREDSPTGGRCRLVGPRAIHAYRRKRAHSKQRFQKNATSTERLQRAAVLQHDGRQNAHNSGGVASGHLC